MIKKIFRHRESYIVILTLVLWLIISSINSNFALPSFMLELTGFNSVYFICALGILPLMIKGHFDLSIGGIITTISMILVALASIGHIPFIFLIVIGIVSGTILGLLNGYIIGKFKVPSVIVTLAMMNIYYGFSKYLHRIFFSDLTMSTSYDIASIQLFGLSIENMMIISMSLLTYYILRYRPLGRSAYALGGNPKLAIRLGYNDYLTTLKLHSYSGLAAGLAAVIYVMTFNKASIDVYSGIEFELIIIVVIGGLNILGGYGSVIGTFAASMFIVVLKSGLVFARISVFWHDMLIGLIIILLVSYDMYKHRSRVKQFVLKGETE